VRVSILTGEDIFILSFLDVQFNKHRNICTMASISAGTRNLKFMQRGKQLPPNPSTPAAAQASSANTPTPSAQTPVRTTQTQGADSSVKEEEEQWVLPSRSRASKGKGKPPPNSSSQKSSARPRVIVVNEPSYLAFVGADAHAKTEQGLESDDDEMNGGTVIANGRLTFGTLPAKETVSISHDNAGLVMRLCIC
jgi:hypothetical protein